MTTSKPLVRPSKRKYSSKIRYWLVLFAKAAITIMLPLVTLTVALFANFKMYHCSTIKPFDMDFLLDGSVVGQFDSRLYNGRIGPKISMRGDIFVKVGFKTDDGQMAPSANKIIT